MLLWCKSTVFAHLQLSLGNQVRIYSLELSHTYSDSNNRNALHIAAAKGHAEVCRAILHIATSLPKEAYPDEDEVKLFATSKSSNLATEIVEIEAGQRWEHNSQYKPFDLAILAGQAEVAHVLLEYGALQSAVATKKAKSEDEEEQYKVNDSFCKYI